MLKDLLDIFREEAEKKEEVEETVTSDEDLVDEINSVDPDNDIIEFIESSDDEEEFSLPAFSEVEEDGEEVVKTTLPYDFFGEDNSLEFVEEQDEEEAEAPDILEFNKAFESAESDVEFVTEDEEESVEDEVELEEVEVPLAAGSNNSALSILLVIIVLLAITAGAVVFLQKKKALK